MVPTSEICGLELKDEILTNELTNKQYWVQLLEELSDEKFYNVF